ncbi:unnamed protein product [Brassica rapa subsp. trilocularis]
MNSRSDSRSLTPGHLSHGYLSLSLPLCLSLNLCVCEF